MWICTLAFSFRVKRKAAPRGIRRAIFAVRPGARRKRFGTTANLETLGLAKRTPADPQPRRPLSHLASIPLGPARQRLLPQRAAWETRHVARLAPAERR